MREYFIKTERLGFSIWEPADFPVAMDLWGSPEVTRYIAKDGHLSEDEIRQRLLREIDSFHSSGVQYWPVYLLETNQNIGCCGLRPYKPDENVLEMGVHLKHDCWGKGYAVEACKAVIAYALNTLRVQGLFAGHNPQNQASAQLLKKLGFVYTHDEFYAPTGLQHPSYMLTRKSYSGKKA